VGNVTGHEQVHYVHEIANRTVVMVEGRRLRGAQPDSWMLYYQQHQQHVVDEVNH